MSLRNLVLTSALAASVLAVGAAAAAPSGPQGRTWAEVAKLPDFTTGIWEIPLGPRPRGAAGSPFTPPAPPQLTPAYAAKLKAYNEARAKGNEQDTPAANCVPPGMPEMMGQPYPLQIMFGPGQVSLQAEAYQQIRHIYTDGRKHPDDPNQTYNGDSIGHWEGKTLVVDTVGFTTDTPLGQNYGIRHSEKMHIVERMRLTDPDTLEIVTTIDDPEALTQPWTNTRTFKRHKDWTIAEYVCEQNNRNLVDENGKAGIVLAPPPKSE
jgi:hypothetical protein